MISSVSSRLRPLYLRSRAVVRGFVVRHPALDLTVGRTLVRIDVLLRRLGLVSAMDASARAFSYEGCDFTFDGNNRDLAETVATTGEYERPTLEAIRALLGPGGTFVDLGANLGFFTVLAARAVGPSGRVHAFEPTPATFALLRGNVERNGVTAQVTCVDQAVADRPGRARFAMFDAAQANQLEIAGEDAASATIDVTVTSLDAYFEAAGWPRVDVIKMDVEGAESAVLRGMVKLIERQPALRLIFEFHKGQLERTSTSGASLIDEVLALGFDRFEVLFRGRQPIELPAEMARLERLAERSYLNILAWRSR